MQPPSGHLSEEAIEIPEDGDGEVDGDGAEEDGDGGNPLRDMLADASSELASVSAHSSAEGQRETEENDDREVVDPTTPEAKVFSEHIPEEKRDDEMSAEELAALLAVSPDSEAEPEPSPPPKRRRVPDRDNAPAAQRGDAPIHRVHTSPHDWLIPITPHPWCSISLNHNDHRWIANFRKNVHCEVWIDQLANKSFSCTLDKTDPLSWRTALRKVHELAWTKWQLGGGNDNPGLKLADGIVPQQPGVIDESVYQGLAPFVAAMPERKKYR